MAQIYCASSVRSCSSCVMMDGSWNTDDWYSGGWKAPRRRNGRTRSRFNKWLKHKSNDIMLPSRTRLLEMVYKAWANARHKRLYPEHAAFKNLFAADYYQSNLSLMDKQTLLRAFSTWVLIQSGTDLMLPALFQRQIQSLWGR